VCPHPSPTVFHVVLTRLHACVVVGAPGIHGSAMLVGGSADRHHRNKTIAFPFFFGGSRLFRFMSCAPMS
jgi:hypothetical protein